MSSLSLCLFFASFVSFFLFCVSLFLGVRLPVKEAAPPERESRERDRALLPPRLCPTTTCCERKSHHRKARRLREALIYIRIHTHTFEHKTRCNTIILTMSEDDKTKFLKCFEQLKEELVRDEIEDNQVQSQSIDTGDDFVQRPAREIEPRNRSHGRDTSFTKR